tara:strand:+ start:189 stop:374 length:186 start_codon:yes stop_codon:yes gene_type:complete
MKKENVFSHRSTDFHRIKNNSLLYENFCAFCVSLAISCFWNKTDESAHLKISIEIITTKIQ